MNPAVSAESGSVQRTVHRIVCEDVLACLYRLRRLLAESDPVPPPLLELAARRFGHLRLLIDALGSATPTPVLSAEMYTGCLHTLDEIQASLRAGVTTGCDLAIRLVESIGAELR
jgi:hypothetical protein